jgi:hypothetical protein
MAAVMCIVAIPLVWVALALGFRHLEGWQRQKLIAVSLHASCHPGWLDEIEAWLRHQH